RGTETPGTLRVDVVNRAFAREKESPSDDQEGGASADDDPRDRPVGARDGRRMQWGWWHRAFGGERHGVWNLASPVFEVHRVLHHLAVRRRRDDVVARIEL